MKIPSIDVVFRSLKGELMKNLLKLGLIKIPNDPLNKTEIRDKKLIVSLTSYGRRIKEVAPYAIMSMMRQSYRPDEIILWLDENEIKPEELPKQIKKLTSKGLQVKFCTNIRSFKKLLPTLSCYPEDLIFTIDDDIYYPTDILEHVMNAHFENEDAIIGVRGYIPTFENGVIKEYSKWERIKGKVKGKCIIITGGAGCLYQKRLLYKDICDLTLISKLAPTADDLWFSFMAILNKTQIEILDISKRDTISIDSFYQRFHSDSSLAKINCGQMQNDIQMSALMNHYGVGNEALVELISKYNIKV